MQLLNIFDSGALIYVIFGIFLLLQGFFIYQMVTHSKANGTKWYKSPFLIYSGLLIGLFIWAVWAIASDYK